MVSVPPIDGLDFRGQSQQRPGEADLPSDESRTSPDAVAMDASQLPQPPCHLIQEVTYMLNIHES